MNSLERVLATLNHEVPDRVPVDFSMTDPFRKMVEERLNGQDPLEYFDVDVRMVSPADTKLDADFTAYFDDLPENATIDEWGMAQIPRDYVHYTEYRHPMTEFASLQELENYPFPDVDADYRYGDLPREVAALHERGLAVVGANAMTIFERSWGLRGMEQLLIDLIANHDFAAALLDRVAGVSKEVSRRYALAGVDVLHLGDDVGMQDRMLMDPAMWRQWFKPRMADIIETAKAIRSDLLVFYHSDGYIEPIIPELIEIGVDSLNPVQPECMDPAEIRRMYGSRLSQWGTIGTQTTFPFGTPEEMRATVKERIDTAGPDALVLGPTHALQPDVPYENLVAFCEAVRDYRL